jgi:hypothetical protein
MFGRPRLGGAAMPQIPIGKFFGLSLVTFGIYTLVWVVKTKGAMVAQGADIPTSWFLIIPIANILYMWKWAGGVERVTNGASSQATTFVLITFLSIIGFAIVQNQFNKGVTGTPTIAPA